MFFLDSPFLYYSHRSQQEQIAAINARHPRAAIAHRELSRLHAMRARLVAVGKP